MSIYMCIDLKSFYASVECKLRNLNPLTTNLVVADASRSEKTICLAVSPSLKAFGVPSRPRLFEVREKVRVANNERKKTNRINQFTAKSFDSEVLENGQYEIDYIIATPQMAKYIEYSRQVYEIYLQYIGKDDIHVYSIDEVFMDVTSYLDCYKIDPIALASKICQDVLDKLGLTATVGIGTNLYLAKVSMDILAKHMQPNANGTRIAYLDEQLYREKLWSHEPLTDFWRVGRGYYNTLTQLGIKTMGDIAKISLTNEDLLYRLFGVNAELLIDHAWGYETCLMTDIKAYQPQAHSLTVGQVLPEGYDYEKTILVIKEMLEELVLDLLKKKLVTHHLSIVIGYDKENLQKNYCGSTAKDYYGRTVPKGLKLSVRFLEETNSLTTITKSVVEELKYKLNNKLLVRRINIGATVTEFVSKEIDINEHLNLFTDYEEVQNKLKLRAQEVAKEKKALETVLAIKNKYGKSAIIKARDLQDGARTLERNKQIGGHKA